MEEEEEEEKEEEDRRNFRQDPKFFLEMMTGGRKAAAFRDHPHLYITNTSLIPFTPVLSILLTLIFTFFPGPSPGQDLLT